MIDCSARNIGVELLRKLDENRLSSIEFEENWPKKTEDNAVKSIGYWIRTLFDDEHDCIIEIKKTRKKNPF